MKKMISIIAITASFAAVGAVISLALGMAKDAIIKKINERN